MRRFLLAAVAGLLAALPLGALSILTYNVENLFDAVDDGTEYREFDPGRGGWDAEAFQARIASIADVIRKAVPGGPDIVLLQEVENRNALDQLVAQGLRGLGYDWRIQVPKRGLAANVAVISRVPIQKVLTYAIPAAKDGPVRDLLEAQIAWKGSLLYLFNNHWKSKVGGVRATEALRLTTCRLLASRLSEILRQDPGAEFLVAGDLNESVDEYDRVGRRYETALIPLMDPVPAAYAGKSLFLSADPKTLGLASDRLVLYEPWFEISPDRWGSYYYQGDWLTVDHLLLSPGLMDSTGIRYRAGSFTAVRLPFLLNQRGEPRRFSPTSREEGYSDHLPLLVRLDAAGR